jgi:rRNA-processing protein FCF1
LYDLKAGGIIDCLRDSPFAMLTTDFVVDELPETIKNRLIGVHVRETGPDGLYEIGQITDSCQGLSTADASVAWLARTERIPLITNDPKLKQEARRMRVVVRQTIWYMDTMVECEAIVCGEALDALTSMKFGERRSISDDDYTDRLQRWAVHTDD